MCCGSAIRRERILIPSKHQISHIYLIIPTCNIISREPKTEIIRISLVVDLSQHRKAQFNYFAWCFVRFRGATEGTGLVWRSKFHLWVQRTQRSVDWIKKKTVYSVVKMIKRPGAKTKQKKCNKFGSNVSVLKNLSICKML